MKSLYAILAFTLLTSQAALADEDPLSALFSSLLSRDFKSAYAFIKNEQFKPNGERENKLKYLDQFGQEDTVSASQIYGDIERVEKLDRSCVADLSANKTEALFRCSREGELGQLLTVLEKYSKTELGAFSEKYEKAFSAHVLDKKKKEAEERIAEQKIQDEKSKLESTPQFQKCTLLAENFETKGLLRLWEKNLIRQKENVKVAGGMSNQMALEIEKTLGAIDSFKGSIRRTDNKIKALSGINVTDAACKKMIPSFGSSRADRYEEN